MKQLVIMLFISGLSFRGFAQSKAVLEFHEKFKENSKYVSVRIEGGLLRSLANFETNDPETEEFLDLISKIDAIDIHSINILESGFNDNNLLDFTRRIKRENFEDLMVVNDYDSKINFLVKESGGKITDLVLLIDNPEEFTVLSISGDIDLRTISKLSGKMDFKGSEELGKLNKK